MKQKNTGFTIVEVMIFLAVSGVLMASALLLVNGQQQKTQFAQAIREIDAQIRDIMNDVASGVYNNTGDFRCEIVDDGPPRIEAGANRQGANVGCVFIGRVFQFQPGSAALAQEKYNVFSIAGRQYQGDLFNSKLVSDLPQAKPLPIAPNSSYGSLNSTAIDLTEYNQLEYGLSIKDNTDSARPGLSYNDGTGPQRVGGFGFFSNFTNYPNGGANFESGRQFTDIWVIPYSQLGEEPASFADRIIAMGDGVGAQYKNPIGGITLCFHSAGTDQYGKIVIGDNQQRLATTFSIGSKGDGSICQ